VQNMIQRLLTLDRRPVTDAADALAVAICHAHVARLGRVLPKGVASTARKQARVTSSRTRPSAGNVRARRL
jgi:crossover junction endodeoxyribonuclease RuvC